MNNKIKLRTFIFILGILSFSFGSDKINISGKILTVFNSIKEKDQPEKQAKRSQFDAAANIDLFLKIAPNVSGNIQLQTSTGGGSLGLNSNQVALTDINLQLDFSEHFSLIMGSFDTPFGTQTALLTNNASTFNNAFILNSLFYSAFAETNVGTLNTVGIMANLNWHTLHAALAATNGTGEGALNPDGNFEIVANVGNSFFDNLFDVTSSVLFSDDSSKSGVSGLGAKINAWMIDAQLIPLNSLIFRGYLGSLSFDDGISTTKDLVDIWMVESKYIFNKSIFAAIRFSGWFPEDNNGDGLGYATNLVLPGFAGDLGSNTAVTDQKLHRIQLGFGYSFTDDLQLKLDLFSEKYYKTNDVNSAIFALNAAF